MLLVCALGLACAPKRIGLGNDVQPTSPLFMREFYRVPLRPGSADALLRLLQAREKAGGIGSFALSGHRLLIRQLKDCCAELEVLYNSSFDRPDSLSVIPNDVGLLSSLLNPGLLENRRQRFLGALGNGFLYDASDRDEPEFDVSIDQFVLLNVSPTDKRTPRVLKTIWIRGRPHELAAELGLLSPQNELRKIRALLAAGKAPEARALLDRDAWLFELTAEGVTSGFKQLSAQLHPKPVQDDGEDLVLALKAGDVFDRLKILERARSRLTPDALKRVSESIAQLLDEVTTKAELAEMQGRLATAAFLYRARASIDLKVDSSRASELETTMRSKCQPKIHLGGTLATEKSVDAPGAIEVVGATPLVKMSPKFTREERTSIYKGPVKLTERFSGEGQRRLVEIASRLKEIEDERAKSPATASTFDKEVSDLNAERTKIFDAAATKREMGDLPHHYFATIQTWTASLVMSAVTADGEKIETTVEYRSVPRVRVTADPEHNVAGVNEWIDEADARKDAIAFGRRALLDKIAEQLVEGRTRACIVAGAENVEGSAEDRLREKQLRESMQLQRSTMQ